MQRRGKALNANLLLTLSPSSSSSACSEEEPEGTLPKDKLITLCKYEPILKWMRSCDHILYQALVEILIPDVLRPVPSEYPQPHLALATTHHKDSPVKTHLEVFVLNIMATAEFLLQHCSWGDVLYPPGNSPPCSIWCVTYHI